MTVYLSPASGVDLLTSSLGPLYPIQDQNDGDRATYFIYYSHDADVGPWELSLDLEVSYTCRLKKTLRTSVTNADETVTIQIKTI